MNIKNLSANTLFHFTNSLENIVNILSNEFCPRYCMEDFRFIGDDECAIPMVCFCDIPLSQIRNHIGKYGGYAIGLEKNWGIKNGINPVFYVLPDSFPTNKINDAVNILGEQSENEEITDTKVTTELSKSRHLMWDFINYMKPYEGKAWNKKNFDGEYTRFYDEREWRYIPNIEFDSEHEDLWFLTKDEFLNEDIRNESNKKIAELNKLSFTPKDIKYIIVNSDEEILTLCNAIDMIKGDKYTQNEMKILKTRIISKEQILSDF